jgi:hypothetical protein
VTCPTSKRGAAPLVLVSQFSVFGMPFYCKPRGASNLGEKSIVESARPRRGKLVRWRDRFA